MKSYPHGLLAPHGVIFLYIHNAIMNITNRTTAIIVPTAHASINWSTVIIVLYFKRTCKLSTGDNRRNLRGSAGR